MSRIRPACTWELATAPCSRALTRVGPGARSRVTSPMCSASALPRCPEEGRPMKVTVQLPGALRELARGERAVVVEVDEPATVGTLLDALARQLPAVERRVRDETGTLRRHVNVFVGDVNVRDGAGLAEPLSDGAEVRVIPAISGG